MLTNTVVVERRTTTPNETGEQEESFTDAGSLSAAVQDRALTQLSLPDVDGPIIVNAVIYTEYQAPDTIRHLDRLRQVDVSPARRYRVINPADAAGRHHHLEIACRFLDEPVGSVTVPPVVPEPPVAVPGVYGSGVSGDSRANQQVGAALNARLSYRFRASTTSAAQTLRVQQRGGAAYSGGDGGAIRASLQADTAGEPSGTILASLTWNPGNPGGNWEVWTLLTFTSPATLTADTLYHLVFDNVAADPIHNWISLNMLFTFGSMPTPRQGAFSDDFATLYAEPTSWVLQPNHLPIFDLAYSDGSHDGQGYIGTLWDKYGSITGTANMVRQRLTVSGDVTVTAAHVRLKRISGTEDLVVRLENGDGSLIEAVSIAASEIALGLLPDGTAPSLAGDTWVTATFLDPHVLADGQTYNLRLSTGAATQYTAVPLQEGGSKGLASQVFGTGDGQRTVDGGTTWANLYLFDNVDLQFWFESEVLGS